MRGKVTFLSVEKGGQRKRRINGVNDGQLLPSSSAETNKDAKQKKDKRRTAVPKFQMCIRGRYADYTPAITAASSRLCTSRPCACSTFSRIDGCSQIVSSAPRKWGCASSTSCSFSGSNAAIRLSSAAAAVCAPFESWLGFFVFASVPALMLVAEVDSEVEGCATGVKGPLVESCGSKGKE
jgi:hypothetical protein